MVIELSPSIINSIQFQSRILNKEKIFQLSALVGSNCSHFMCPVMKRNGNIFGRKYIDNLQANKISRGSLHEFFQNNSLDWFFST